MLRITIISILLCFGTLFFNNCSDVDFSQKTGDSPSTVGGSGCSGPDCGSDANAEGDGEGGNPDGDGPRGEGEFVNYTFNESAPARSNKLDIVLIIDNSGSMEKDRKKLAEKLEGFVADLEASGLNWQMCHTTTQVVSGFSKLLDKDALEWAASGRPKVLNTNTSSNIDTVFRDSMNAIKDGTGFDGSGNEQGIRSLYTFIQNRRNAPCFRSEAALTSIVLSDEDEASLGRSNLEGLDFKSEPRNLMDMIRDTFGAELPYTHHSIVIRSNDPVCWKSQDQEASNIDARYGKVYEELSNSTGGIIGDICADSYASQLSGIKDRIDYTLDAISLACDPVPGSLVVNGKNSSEYKVIGNKVIFNPSLAEGTVVTGSYTCIEHP